MKNPFKKNIEKTETITGTGSIGPVPTPAPAPEIRTVIGYAMEGAIYASPEEARKAYVLPRLKELVWYTDMFGNCYVSPRSPESWKAVNDLFTMDIPVKPLFEGTV